MAAKLVPTVRTKYSLQDFIRGLVEGWYKKFKVIPKKESIGVLYAQWSLETGGGSSCWNNNIGNVKFVPSSNPDNDNGKEYMMLANVWEIINNQKITFQPPHPATWFRSYPTLADGIAAHMDFLKNKRYKTAWTAVEAGDPSKFSHLLKVAGYYTAPEADYTRLMNMYFNKFMKDTTFDTVVTNLVKSIEPPTPILEPIPEPPLPIPEPSTPITPSEPTKSPFSFITNIFSFLKKS